MGAVLEEVDVLNPLVTSPAAFIKLIEPAITRAEAEGRNAIVVYLPPTRNEMVRKGVDFATVIQDACAKYGIARFWN